MFVNQYYTRGQYSQPWHAYIHVHVDTGESLVTRLSQQGLSSHAEGGKGPLWLWESGWCGAGEPGRRGHGPAALGEKDTRGQLGVSWGGGSISLQYSTEKVYLVAEYHIDCVVLFDKEAYWKEWWALCYKHQWLPIHKISYVLLLHAFRQCHDISDMT